jgi:hypothetical protein
VASDRVFPNQPTNVLAHASVIAGRGRTVDQAMNQLLHHRSVQSVALTTNDNAFDVAEAALSLRRTPK